MKTWFDRISLRWKLVFMMCFLVPVFILMTLYFYNKVYWLQVQSQLGGLMNFVDAKQQGVIRFLGQNEKMAKELAVLVQKSESSSTVNAYFSSIVKTDVFNLAAHPFHDEIESGKREIPTSKVYHAIDWVKGGVIKMSSDKNRIGKPFTRQIGLAPG